MASSDVRSRPPVTITTSFRPIRLTSTAATMHWLPKLCASRSTSAGSRTAAVLTATLSAPARRTCPASSTERIPPPTVNGMKTESATRPTISRVVRRSSCVAEMSRNTNSSAPSASYRAAWATGSPASRSASKCTPFTTRPPATSRQGMMRRASTRGGRRPAGRRHPGRRGRECRRAHAARAAMRSAPARPRGSATPAGRARVQAGLPPPPRRTPQTPGPAPPRPGRADRTSRPGSGCTGARLPGRSPPPAPVGRRPPAAPPPRCGHGPSPRSRGIGPLGRGAAPGPEPRPLPPAARTRPPGWSGPSSRVPLGEGRQERDAGALRFLGVELGAEHGVLPDQRRKDIAVLPGGQNRAGGQAGRMIAVYVVVELGLGENLAHDRMPVARRGGLDPRPADVGDREIDGEPANVPGKQAQAPEARRLLASLEEELEAEADPHHRPAGPRGVAHRVSQAGAREVRHGLAEVANAGHDDPLGPAHGLRIRRQRGRVPAGGQRPYHAPQVVHSVVHHRDHSTPLVEGTPDTRGSRAVASSSARAKALNAASTMWWGLSPRTRSRWTVSPAFCTSAPKNSGVRNTS